MDCCSLSRRDRSVSSGAALALPEKAAMSATKTANARADRRQILAVFTHLRHRAAAPTGESVISVGASCLFKYHTTFRCF
jgi:hypothetical protein